MSKVSLIRLQIGIKYYWWFKVLMLIISLPVVMDIYETYSAGYVIDRELTFIKGQDFGYWLYLLKQMSFALFFIWLGTFGSIRKISTVD